MRQFINLVESIELDEAGAGASRINQHIQNGTPFFMISACRANLDAARNKRRTELLRSKFAQMPVSYVVTGGEFQEIGQEAPTEEVSFFVMPKPGLAPEHLSKLGEGLMRTFDQDAILFGNGEEVYYVGNDGETFSIGDAATFSAKEIAQAGGFSKIKGRKFAFTTLDKTPAATPYGRR